MSIEQESLVEMTAVEQFINMCRVVREELEVLDSMLRNYHESSDIQILGKVYERIRDIKNRGEDSSISLMEYLIRGSEILMYSSSYINIVRMLDRIVQQVDGVAYRVYLARRSNIMLDRGIIDRFSEIIDLEKKQLDSLENSISKIRLSPRKILEELNNVFKIEEDIDTVFRNSLFEIYTKYSGYVTALLILKDIFEHLEEISDVFKNIGEEIRYLAMARSSMT